nr:MULTISPECIES: PilZ domain-containing protein [Lactiplantibacillus]
MGRPVYRKNERFIRRVAGTVQATDGQWHPIMTEDVSEGGIAFRTTDGPVETIAEGDHIKLTVKHQDFTIHLSGQVARISHRDDDVIYSVQVEVTADENRNHYLQLIYDGSNKTLPSVQDTWVTPFDELYMNLVVRARTYERKLSRRFNRF